MDPPIASQRRFNQRNGWRCCNKALFIQVVLVHSSALCTYRRWETMLVKADPSLHTFVTFWATCFCCLSFLKFQRLQSKRRGSNGGISMFPHIYVKAKMPSLQHYFLTGMWILFIRRILVLNILWKHKDLHGFQQVCVPQRWLRSKSSCKTCNILLSCWESVRTRRPPSGQRFKNTSNRIWYQTDFSRFMTHHRCYCSESSHRSLSLSHISNLWRLW